MTEIIEVTLIDVLNKIEQKIDRIDDKIDRLSTYAKLIVYFEPKCTKIFSTPSLSQLLNQL